MINTLKLSLLLWLVMGWVACKQDEPQQASPITGNWYATSLMVGDSSMGIDIKSVSLALQPNKRFVFVNNLGKIEAGYYLIQDSILVYTDTTRTPLNESAVHIYKLSGDSLVLRMNMEGQETLMHMRRRSE